MAGHHDQVHILVRLRSASYGGLSLACVSAGHRPAEALAKAGWTDGSDTQF